MEVEVLLLFKFIALHFFFLFFFYKKRTVSDVPSNHLTTGYYPINVLYLFNENRLRKIFNVNEESFKITEVYIN